MCPVRALWPLSAQPSVWVRMSLLQGVRLGRSRSRPRRLPAHLYAAARLYAPVAARPAAHRRVCHPPAEPGGVGRPWPCLGSRAGERRRGERPLGPPPQQSGQADGGRRGCCLAREPGLTPGGKCRRSVSCALHFQGFPDFLSQNKTTSKFGENSLMTDALKV